MLVVNAVLEREIRRALGGDDFDEKLVFALLQIHRDLYRAFAGFFLFAAFSHELAVDPELEHVIGAQA